MEPLVPARLPGSSLDKGKGEKVVVVWCPSELFGRVDVAGWSFGHVDALLSNARGGNAVLVKKWKCQPKHSSKSDFHAFSVNLK